MRRPLALVVVLLVVAATVPLPVSAHSNHLTATSQVSDDGTVVVETVFVSQRAHLVVHADDGGDLGEALGSRSLAPSGLQRNVEVSLDDAVREEWNGSRDVWVALHADDGDGEYDADDPVFTRFNQPVAERISLGTGDAALVTGQGFYGQTATGPDLSVGRATLPGDGFVVVRDADTDRVVGTEALAAGTHDDLTVALNESYYAANGDGFSVRVQLALDDGDGAFGDGDRLVRAGDTPVETTLPVSPGGGAVGPNATADGPAVNTPGEPRVNTPVGTTAEQSTAGQSSDAGSTDGATTDDGDGSAGAGPGFGVEVALVVALLASLVWFGSRIRR